MTTLVRWNPARELGSLQSEVDRIFDGFLGANGGLGGRRWTPAMDLSETDEELVLRADLPGLSEEDVTVEVEDGVLTVSGERSVSNEERSGGYHRVERRHGSFSRSLTLPSGVEADQVSAAINRGVLEVRIPKPEGRKPHRVAIGAESVESTGSEK